ncbi:MAG: siroheme synthase CysG, partial [Gammaproteobacteria bacterium]|nr:siroheme synthase CysG [Gammaproteobacteria bacterium]
EDARARRQFWERVLGGPIAELVFAGRDHEAEGRMQAELERSGAHPETGEVFLVGAGPGDPELVTLRALRVLQSADVIVHDRLVSQPVLDLCRREAERIYVGKERAFHSVPQEGINSLLVRLAKEGKRVVRLKGGDPFIFGRGGEEIESLAAEEVPFQVIPGITAASGCAAYAGIPLTHRDFAQSVMFVAGHQKDGKLTLNWDALVRPGQTIVFYMGLAGIEALCNGLIENGMRPDMPAALVQRGTQPDQRVLIGTLDGLPARVEESGVTAPTLIIVGEVVQLHDRLSWFNRGPGTG